MRRQHIPDFSNTEVLEAHAWSYRNTLTSDRQKSIQTRRQLDDIIEHTIHMPITCLLGVDYTIRSKETQAWVKFSLLAIVHWMQTNHATIPQRRLPKTSEAIFTAVEHLKEAELGRRSVPRPPTPPTCTPGTSPAYEAKTSTSAQSLGRRHRRFDPFTPQNRRSFLQPSQLL
ncbi:uncharacterized protein JCM10292_004759 [Rhodotorula paludigena]|uniref:uncharacterized protein n=1 Tax=Rhodotorula paludigena TaxID=86838 RepID=UPI003178321C